MADIVARVPLILILAPNVNVPRDELSNFIYGTIKGLTSTIGRLSVGGGNYITGKNLTVELSNGQCSFTCGDFSDSSYTYSHNVSIITAAHCM